MQWPALSHTALYLKLAWENWAIQMECALIETRAALHCTSPNLDALSPRVSGCNFQPSNSNLPQRERITNCSIFFDYFAPNRIILDLCYHYWGLF